MKTRLPNLHVKNQIIDRIIQTMVTQDRFLIVGHKKPDEDCVASTVAMALLLSKFYKEVVIYQSEEFQEQLTYLYNICGFNQIGVISSEEDLPDSVDVVISCDTPKPSMIDSCDRIEQFLKNPDVLKIELDHHLGADSEYIGEDAYCLVDQASSTCELIGILAYKLNNRKALLRQFLVSELLSRNIVVAILTGIVGDSKMGVYLKTRRDKVIFRAISNLYNNLLAKTTTNSTYIADMEEIFDEIQKLSQIEEKCYNFAKSKRQSTNSVSYVILCPDDFQNQAETCDFKVLSSVSKKITDDLAEESHKLGLTVHQDRLIDPQLYQFKLRRSMDYDGIDLRDVLKAFQIKNGGGHEGAVGFRLPVSEVPNLSNYVQELLMGIEKLIEEKECQ